MPEIAIDLKTLCDIAGGDWDIVASLSDGETVSVRPDGSVYYQPDQSAHPLEFGSLTQEQHARVLAG